MNKPDQRRQQSVGIGAAAGKIITIADDDTFCSGPDVLRWLLAPLENPRVGGVNNLHYPDVPEERRSADVVTPWEAISIKGLDLFNGTVTTRYGADATIWCMIGRVMVYRAEILRDPAFISGFNSETFLGRSIKTGNDNFYTHWLRARNWDMVLQCAEGADVTTAPVYDGRVLVNQMLRWLRSSAQNQSRVLLSMPGFFTVLSRWPYMARKMLERILKPAIAAVHMLAWVNTAAYMPLIRYVLYS